MFVVITTCPDRTELFDDRVLALVSGIPALALESTLRWVLAVRLVLAGFTLLRSEVAQSLTPTKNGFFPLEELLRK
jgi:hypothetical protein